ncbi:relaxin receptor 1 [Trichonephila inaurata madagascariensis]|uniref:Relaxin receptor 1 n=1 Tax=Trichonephila inaurata madagascariensis TaxID=2747483 RepID=A0A8X6YCZ8_9ARAC|nr:relaxin receptor 1 [Trichonephila inaurata madagascariensis]
MFYRFNAVKYRILCRWLDGNKLETFSPLIFQNLKRLEVLSLSRNELTSVDSFIFDGLENLKSLAIAMNRLRCLKTDTFGNLTSLLKLDLHGNNIRSIDGKTFSMMSRLESLYFDEFHLCSLALHVRVCEPRGDGISSIAHLLDSVVLRVSVWLVAFVAGLGNVAVLVGRFLLAEPNEVHSFYIKNLSLADLLMSVYLFVIAAYDVAFRGHYIHHETNWRHSWQCSLCGFLSTLSSESSVLILTIITIDSKMTVFRLLQYCAIPVTSTGSTYAPWLLHVEFEPRGDGINSVLTYLIAWSSVYIYSVPPVTEGEPLPQPLSRWVLSGASPFCFPPCLMTLGINWVTAGMNSTGSNGCVYTLKYMIHLDKKRHICKYLPKNIHDIYFILRTITVHKEAWEYSTFLFCGLNLAAFLFILFAYISMFFTISNSKIGLRSTQQLQDRTIAKRFAFIVGTDFLCWVPIVLIKVIAMGGNDVPYSQKT